MLNAEQLHAVEGQKASEVLESEGKMKDGRREEWRKPCIDDEQITIIYRKEI